MPVGKQEMGLYEQITRTIRIEGHAISGHLMDIRNPLLQLSRTLHPVKEIVIEKEAQVGIARLGVGCKPNTSHLFTLF
jgi:hypothetical protein